MMIFHDNLWNSPIPNSYSQEAATVTKQISFCIINLKDMTRHILVLGKQVNFSNEWSEHGKCRLPTMKVPCLVSKIIILFELCDIIDILWHLPDFVKLVTFVKYELFVAYKTYCIEHILYRLDWVVPLET